MPPTRTLRQLAPAAFFLLLVSCGQAPEEQATDVVVLPEPNAVLQRTTGADDYNTAILQYKTLSSLQIAAEYYRSATPGGTHYRDLYLGYGVALAHVDEHVNALGKRTIPDQKERIAFLDQWHWDKEAYDTPFADKVFADYGLPLTMDRIKAKNAAVRSADSLHRANGDHAMDPALLKERSQTIRTGVAILALLPVLALQICCVFTAIEIRKGFRRARGTAALDPVFPTLFVADGVEYHLRSFTGEVKIDSTNVEHASTVRDDQNNVPMEQGKFHIVDKHGKEHVVHLTNADFAIRPGSILSAVWFADPNGFESDHVLFLDHDLDTHVFLWSNMEPYFPSRAARPFLFALLGTLLVAVQVGYSFSVVDKIGMPTLSTVLLVLSSEATIFLLVGLLVLALFGGRKTAQKTAFNNTGIPRIVNYLKKRRSVPGSTT